jgi:hypothetical protein
MKALEHLIIEEIAQIRAMESNLQSAYAGLGNAPETEVAGFVNALADLEHRAMRVSEMLEALSQPEPLAA